MALMAGSRFSMRLIARASARMSPERSRLTRSGRLGPVAQPGPREVVPDHPPQTVRLLAASRRGIRGRRRDDRGAEEVRKPFRGERKLAVRVVEYLGLRNRAVPDRVRELKAGGIEPGGHAGAETGRVVGYLGISVRTRPS